MNREEQALLSTPSVNYAGPHDVSSSLENPAISTKYVADSGNLDWVNFHHLGEGSAQLLSEFQTVYRLPTEDCCSGFQGAELLVHLYTHNLWYTSINNVIKNKTRKYYPLIHTMANWISEDHDADTQPVLYRGLRGVNISSDIRTLEFADFTSWSSSQTVAERFAGPGGIILKIERTDKVVARSVSRVSRYSESEFLSIPFSYVSKFQRAGSHGSCSVYTCEFIEPLDVEYGLWQVGLGPELEPELKTALCYAICCCSPILLPLFAFISGSFILMALFFIAFIPLFLLPFYESWGAVFDMVVMPYVYRRSVFVSEFSLKERFYYWKKTNTKIRWRYFLLWITMVYNIFYLLWQPVIAIRFTMRTLAVKQAVQHEKMKAAGGGV